MGMITQLEKKKENSNLTYGEIENLLKEFARFVSDPYDISYFVNDFLVHKKLLPECKHEHLSYSKKKLDNWERVYELCTDCGREIGFPVGEGLDKIK